MRIAFISDLHGCLDALNAVLADAQSRHVDEVVCLGDIVDMGPQPNEVVERLRSLGVKSVRGNHDPLDEHPEIEFLQDLENWTRAQLSENQQAWLSDLPFQQIKEVEGFRLLLVHGCPESNAQGIVCETSDELLNQWLLQADADVILAGHTHVPLIRRVLNGLVVNVGSTSMPFKEPLPNPPQAAPFSDYAIVDIEQGAISVEHRRLPLDMDALKQAIERAGMPHGDQLIGVYSKH